MKYRQLKVMVLSLTICSFVVTGFGGAYASGAYAAVPDENVQENASINKDVVGGLVAIGLIAAIASRHGDANDSSSPANSVSQPSTPPASTSNGSTVSTAPITPSNGTTDELRAFNLLNADRAKNGLPALKWNSKLAGLAEDYGQDMINRHYFSHYNPEGQSPFDRMRTAGISYSYAGENLAINTSVDTAEQAFMNSPGHRANILNANYTEVGLGVRYDSRGEAYVVQEFSRP
ncbi:MAG: CAP domain-containing protein [Pelosinus sp.]|nr:CAP domain-containing protein [Pelosinus sp.]